MIKIKIEGLEEINNASLFTKRLYNFLLKTMREQIFDKIYPEWLTDDVMIATGEQTLPIRSKDGLWICFDGYEAENLIGGEPRNMYFNEAFQKIAEKYFLKLRVNVQREYDYKKDGKIVEIKTVPIFTEPMFTKYWAEDDYGPGICAICVDAGSLTSNIGSVLDIITSNGVNGIYPEKTKFEFNIN